ncbi:MAG: U32 family peptidase, partial [Clostridia bacterium]|nr:U32 family peptidase [Clostridia bacterium]
MLLSKPEILSPAGSYESLIAAVRSGADAVYIGAKQFNARRNAENFSNEQLKSAIEFCRIRGVKVYLTLNIMLKNSELKEALGVVEHAYKCGVDGIIIADLGLAKIVHSVFPNLSLHASTQMTVHSPAALYELKKLGICRVVAAREMNKEGLIELCTAAKQLNMEVEVFVHGALCMCVSGQCLLSSVIGGRSGNRGLCAGPCRLPFKVEGGTGYDLSLKDLSLYDYTKELCEMGVASFKIEGRMKRPEYIAAAVSAFRKSVDEGVRDYTLSNVLKNVFSRSGFTAGYYESLLGKEMFGVRTDEDVASSKDTYSYIHNLYRSQRQSVGISLSATVKTGEKIKIEVDDGINKVSVYGDIPQPAKTKELTKEDILFLLSKLGGTPYYAQNVNIMLDTGLFVPTSQINALRRQCTDELDLLRAKAPEIIKREYSFFAKQKNVKEKTKLYIRIADSSQIPENISDIDCIIAPMKIAHNIDIPQGIEAAVELPRWIDSEDAICNSLTKLKIKGFKKAYCSNISAINLAKKLGYEIIGGIGLNVCNDANAEILGEMGVGEVTLSAEISMKDAVNFKTSLNKGLFAYGRIPLMVLKNCPLKNGRGCKECDGVGY